MDKPYNNNSELPRVNNWKEFYEIVNSMSKKRTMLDTDEFCDIK